MGYFKDEIWQAVLDEILDKVVIFEELLIQVMRLKDISIGIVTFEFEVCFLLLG